MISIEPLLTRDKRSRGPMDLLLPEEQATSPKGNERINAWRKKDNWFNVDFP